MKKWTVKQICEYVSDPVLGVLDLEKFPYMTDYSINASEYDRYIKKQFGFRVFDTEYDELNDISQVIEEFKKDVKTILQFNDYEFKALFKTLDLSWSPIENYDKYSNITTTSQGTVNERTGMETDVNITDGMIENHNNIGAQTNTITNNVTTGKQNTSVLDQVRPWETNSVNRDKSKQITDTSARSDTSTENSTLSARGDEQITIYDNLKIENNKTYNSLKDTKNITDSVTEHTHGNIGVMRVDQMLEGARQSALFNFYDHVFSAIFTQTTCIYLE